MPSDIKEKDVFRPLRVKGLTITKRSFVAVYLSADQSITGGTTWHTVTLDEVEKDTLGEFDTGSHQFTPEETGWYFVTMKASFAVGADQDECQVHFREVTGAGEYNVVTGWETASGPAVLNVGGSRIKNLTGGTTYELQVRNKSSDDTILSGDDTTFLNVWRLPV